jgi:hypothetical protein
MAVTAWPRRASSAVMREPALPDAPMTAIFMGFPSAIREYGIQW